MKISKWLLAGAFTLVAPTGAAIAAKPLPTVQGIMVNDGGNIGSTCSDQGENGTTVTNTARVCVNANVAAAEDNGSWSNVTGLSVFADTTTNGRAVVGGLFDVNSLAGGTETWAINPVANIFPGSIGGAISDEVDLNNWGCDPGNIENLSATCKIGAVGELFEGASPFASQEAISISGVSTGNAQWHEGVAAVGLHVVDFATFYQNDGALYGYRDIGAHGQSAISVGGGSTNPLVSLSGTSPGVLDLVASTSTQFAVRMPSAGASDILWPAGGGTLSGDGLGGVSIGGPTGNLKVAGNVNSAGNISAGANDAFVTQDSSGNGAYLSPDNAGGLTIATLRPGAAANVGIQGALSATGLRSSAKMTNAAGVTVTVPDAQIGSAAGFDQFTGPDSFTIGGSAMPDTPAGWVSPAPAFNPTVNMVTAPYGSFNAGCGLCLFMSQDNITANRAGISGVDYRTGPSAMPAIGSNDAVGFYEQPQNYAAKMVLTAASYTATQVVLKTPLTAEQMSLLRTNMYLVTNSIDPTSPTGTASDGLPVNNLMEGFISGWDPAGTYITVAGWASVSGTGVANAIPSTIALDTAYSTYSSPTVFIGAPTKVWGRNTYINYQTPGSNPTTSLIRRFEGEEMDWRYNASKANEVDFHGLTMSFAPTGGFGPAGMTPDSYALLMNGVLPRYVVIQDSGAAPVLIDTGFYQMGSNGESTTTPNAEMFEHDAYADGANLMRLEGRVIHTGTATGWTGAEMDLGLWIDGGQGNNAGTYAGGLKFNANGTAQASVSLCGQNGCAITAQANGLPKIVNVTYSQLPACAANLEGTVAEVTDANTSTFGATITAGGGSNHMMGRCNGTAWVVD